MQTHLLVPSLVFLMFVLFHPTNTQGQSSDEVLKQAITRNGGTMSVTVALNKAFKQKRKDLLILGFDNPNLWDQEEAAILIGKLNDQDIVADLIAILNKQSFWVKQLNGSRNVTMQNGFVEDITTSLKSKIDFDATTVDLYDPNTRAQLINQLKALPNH